MADLIQVRRDAAADWTSNDPTLAAGEPGFESDTNKVKIGDGATAWTSLDYLEVPLAFRDESSVSYTLVIGDGNKALRCTGASAAITIPQESSVDYALGTEIAIRQAGTGTLVLTTTGLTINGSVPAWSQHVETKFRKVASDTWDVV
jgi:hypothetical protein